MKRAWIGALALAAMITSATALGAPSTFWHPMGLTSNGSGDFAVAATYASTNNPIALFGLSTTDLLKPNLMQLPMASPERCSAAVAAHLNGSGKILVLILRR